MTGSEGPLSELEFVLFEECSDALFLTRSDGQLENANAAARGLTNQSLEALRGINLTSLLTEQAPGADFGARGPSTLPEEEGRRAVFRPRPDDELPVLVRTCGVSVADRTCTLVRLTDLRSQAKRDAWLEQIESKQLHSEQAILAQNSFLASMSHEIRTPLNAVMGFAQLLRRDPSLSGASLRRAEGIERAGSHLLKLVNDVLEISKIESGQAKAHLAPCNVEGLVDDVFSLFGQQAAEKDIELRKNIAADVPSSVITDELKLRQILINLVGNALKFTEAGCIAVLVGAEVNGLDQCILHVQVLDNGPGIEQNELSTIFEKFSQGSSSAHTQGTGLGLAISRQYAQLLGGDLTAESEVGRGSFFELRLPVTWVKYRLDTPTPPKSWSEARPHIAQDLRALVVDDDEDSDLVLVAMLEELGFTCRCATSGRNALRLYTTFRPQAVFTDLCMPEMDGIELIEKLRALDGNPELMIVALSAQVFPEHRRAALDAGANAFLPKPFQVAELYSIIARSWDLKHLETEARIPSVRPAPQFGCDAVDLELREAITGAARAGDLDRLLELTEGVQNTELRDYLNATAQRYDYEKIMQFFATRPEAGVGGKS